MLHVISMYVYICVLMCPYRPVLCGGREYRLDVAPPYRGSTSLANLAQLCSSDSERYFNTHTSYMYTYTLGLLTLLSCMYIGQCSTY